MRRFQPRLLIVLAFAVALDFGVPIGTDAHEAFEAFEEAAHAVRARRRDALPRGVLTPAPPRDRERARVQRMMQLDVAASRRPVTLAPARKAPPVLADPAPTLEDH